LPAGPDDIRRARRVVQRGGGNPSAPKRIAWTPDLGGICEVDREIREVTPKMVRRFEEIGGGVDEVSPDFGPSTKSSCAAQSAVRRRSRDADPAARDKIKPTSSGTPNAA
jgi:amidase